MHDDYHVKLCATHADTKEETHNRLLKEAAEEFRRNGVQGTGIAPLMGWLGLTHGGFYAQFDSKNELIAEATGPMSEDALSRRMLAAAEAAPKGKVVRAIVTHYLSAEHQVYLGLIFAIAFCTFLLENPLVCLIFIRISEDFLPRVPLAVQKIIFSLAAFIASVTGVEKRLARYFL